MSIDLVFQSLEAGDVVSFLEQMSSSELSETLHHYFGTSGEMLAESELSDLEENMKESSGNEGARESGSGGISGASVTSSTSGGVVVDLQLIHEDQSMFFDVVQKDPICMEDNHDLQLFQDHGTMSEFIDTNLDHLFDFYHPVEKTVGDWLSTASFHAFEGRSPGEAGPTLQSYPTNGSPGLLGVISDSDNTLVSPPSGSVASQRSQFDFSLLTNPASIINLAPIQEVGSAAMIPIQVVKTERGLEEDEWQASEVSEGEFNAKKERRRQQNRTAARRCRNRKKETFEIMFKAAQKAKLENVELQKEVVRLREKLKSVMQLVKVHQTNCGLQLTTTAISQLRRPVPSTLPG